MPTIDKDAINLEDAEDFKRPSDGNHGAFLQNVEFGPTKAGDREQFVLTLPLSPDDPEAPNLPMRFYVGWPVPEDRDLMWGTRTAYGSKIKTIKDVMTAFGGQESGPITKEKFGEFLQSRIGSPVKVRIKNEIREGYDELVPNVRSLSPA